MGQRVHPRGHRRDDRVDQDGVEARQTTARRRSIRLPNDLAAHTLPSCLRMAKCEYAFDWGDVHPADDSRNVTVSRYTPRGRMSWVAGIAAFPGERIADLLARAKDSRENFA